MKKSKCPIEDYMRIRNLDYKFWLISLGFLIGFIIGHNYPKF